MRPRSLNVWLFAFFQLWLAHAIGYLVHEYAHSFTAWALHGMANPLALDYGRLRLENLLFLDDIDENVDYRTLFAAGRDHVAALSAVAGVCLAMASPISQASCFMPEPNAFRAAGGGFSPSGYAS
jgi:hypothetical protein